MSTTTPTATATTTGRATARATTWRAGHALRRSGGRLRALLAGGLVLGVGSVATLAAWTDTEWVYGGGAADGSGTGVAASVFEVEQNVWDGASGAANFLDREEQALAGGLRFSPLAATSLSPGDLVYAPMQLRTTVRSVGATVTVKPAVLAAGDSAFFSALRYSLRSGVAKADCGASAFLAGSTIGTPLVTSAALTSGSATGALELAPATASAAGTPVDLCFAITLPGGSASSLQGLGATPVWSFDSQSR